MKGFAIFLAMNKNISDLTAYIARNIANIKESGIAIVLRYII
jgi:hypothetical protein